MFQVRFTIQTDALFLSFSPFLFLLAHDTTIHRKFTVSQQESINIPTDVPMFVQLHIVGTRVALETLYDDPALFLSISVSKRIYRQRVRNVRTRGATINRGSMEPDIRSIRKPMFRSPTLQTSICQDYRLRVVHYLQDRE